MNIALILLAAGSSSRLGQSKQLLKINNETLIEHSARAALNSGVTKVVVVLGADEKMHREYLSNVPVEIIYNPEWKGGMGSSIKAGLKGVIKSTPKLDGVIIMVCDQPLITSDNIKNLILKFQETQSSIVASHYVNTNGVPALFDKSLFPELLALPDEQGAKKIIQKNSEKTETVNFPGGAIDIDTSDDYQKFLKLKKPSV